jgi:4-oxalocrotonate tautomerase
MPIIRVEMWKGPSKEVKARLAEAITETVSRIAAIPHEHIRILFTEFEMENWAIGGKLASDMDRMKEPAGNR